MTHLVKPKPPPCPPLPGDLFMSWEQMKQVREMIKQIVSDLMINDPGLNALLQRYVIEAIAYDPRVAPIIQQLINQQISQQMGVTDGSNAQPGQIGEFISGTTTINFTAYPDDTAVTISPLTVQPGDWDLWASLYPQVFVGGADFALSPVPAGMSHDMSGNQSSIVTGALGFEASMIIAMAARGSFTTPTVLSWLVNIYQHSDQYLTAGTAIFRVEGRRRR